MILKSNIFTEKELHDSQSQLSVMIMIRENVLHICITLRRIWFYQPAYRSVIAKSLDVC